MQITYPWILLGSIISRNTRALCWKEPNVLQGVSGSTNSWCAPSVDTAYQQKGNHRDIPKSVDVPQQPVLGERSQVQKYIFTNTNMESFTWDSRRYGQKANCVGSRDWGSMTAKSTRKLFGLKYALVTWRCANAQTHPHALRLGWVKLLPYKSSFSKTVVKVDKTKDLK